jgi:hypothetical protein
MPPHVVTLAESAGNPLNERFQVFLEELFSPRDIWPWRCAGDGPTSMSRQSHGWRGFML